MSDRTVSPDIDTAQLIAQARAYVPYGGAWRGVEELLAALADALEAAEAALKQIRDRHPDALPGEHPAVDIARAALAGSGDE